MLLVFAASCMLLSACQTAEVKKENTTLQTDTIAAETKDTLRKDPAHMVRDYAQRVQDFKKMPEATPADQIAKYEVFADRYIDYLIIVKNEAYYSPMEKRFNKQAFDILRDATISLKEKMKKNIAVFTQQEMTRLDAADARMNAVIEQTPE